MCILLGENALLATIYRGAGVPGLHVDFYDKACSMQLNVFILNSGVCGIIEWKENRAVHMVFKFVGT